jgi:hypothetical protein
MSELDIFTEWNPFTMFVLVMGLATVLVLWACIRGWK